MPKPISTQELPDIISTLREVLGWLDAKRHDQAAICINEAIERLNAELAAD